MYLSHKIKLQPTKKQEVYFIKASGVNRFTYNWALSRIEENYKKGIKSSGYDLSRELNSIKRKEFPWMYEVSKCCCEQSIYDLYQGYKNWWKEAAKKPIYKKKGKCRDSFYLGQNHFNIKNKKIRIAKLGWVRTTKPLRFTGKLISVTISKITDKWFASILVKIDNSTYKYPHICKNQDILGIDLGIKNLLTFSDGTKIESIKAFFTNLKKLKRFSKELSRRKRGSKNKKKSALKLAKLYYKISCIRNNYIHLITSNLVNNYRYIGMENLNIQGMIKNKKLSKHIVDSSWFEIKRQLHYKSKLSGSYIVEVDQWFPSSKICNECGYKNIHLKLSDRKWKCKKCEIVLDRDINAAINLKRVARGYQETINACGYKEVVPYCETRIKSKILNAHFTLMT